MPRCHSPENISTRKHPGHGTATHSMGSDHSHSPDTLRSKVTAYVDTGFQDGYPGKNHIITVIYHNPPQTSPTCPPISPKNTGRELAGCQPGSAEGDIPSKLSHMLKYFISEPAWLKAAVSILCKIGFPPHDFVQQLSALNTHSAV